MRGLAETRSRRAALSAHDFAPRKVPVTPPTAPYGVGDIIGCQLTIGPPPVRGLDTLDSEDEGYMSEETRKQFEEAKSEKQLHLWEIEESGLLRKLQTR